MKEEKKEKKTSKKNSTNEKVIPKTTKKASATAKESSTKKETEPKETAKKNSAKKTSVTEKEEVKVSTKKSSTKKETTPKTIKKPSTEKKITKKIVTKDTENKTSNKNKKIVAEKQLTKIDNSETPKNKPGKKSTSSQKITKAEDKNAIEKAQKKPVQHIEKTQKKELEEIKRTPEKENVQKIVNKQVQKKRKKLKKWVYVAILIILIIIWLTSLYKIINWHFDNKEVEKQTEKINETTEVKEVDEGEIISPPENQFDPYWDFIKMPLVSVDFDKLINENNDTIGWIFVDNSNINYPVVQGADNKYYLTHDFNKEYNDAGWIYMDYRNNNEEFDKNTIIYGHSRLDKSLFGTLRNATTEEWFNNKDNHIIKFSTPYENTMWMVFSTYTIKAESYYLKTDFESDSEYNIWLNKMMKRSKFNYNTEVTTDNQVLTLSSCYTTDGIRVVVHAKLIKKEVR